MILLSNTCHSPVALSGYGLAIIEERRIEFRLRQGSGQPDAWREC